ncbi:hypothetical protein [Pseudomonas sp. R37(2017)]|uniref:hypothetical protein n=1 Tax=Pseudomonas sp. R37(2017) TaxID=1981685 RepID=UPI000A1DA711|nr:hypothetical protein [Pseudomonas sp. R37(2017)]
MFSSENRLVRVFDLAYECLRQKINSGRIKIENEASLQLQFASILKSVGELFEVEQGEHFSIELEKPFSLEGQLFGKSGSEKAKIDIYFYYTNAATKIRQSCAVELKFFKKKNQREPNNRYDVFADLHNLEQYGPISDLCFMVVATDHSHYVSWPEYSKDTEDFDFRDGRTYTSGTVVTYRTTKPYGKPITLYGSYDFNWDKVSQGFHFLRIPVIPHKRQ